MWLNSSLTLTLGVCLSYLELNYRNIHANVCLTDKIMTEIDKNIKNE